jgi:4-amino-4-deoxy-L-arabinose transferase-like glycosyltransferase
MNFQERVLPGRSSGATWIWLAATAYFVFNALTLGLASPTADLDQAQQLVLSQDLSLGYGAQPPLYTWLVNLLFSITGPDRLVLLAFKALLLSALVLGVLKAGRELGFDARQQVLLVMGLALIPSLIWEAQRDLTHTVLATVISAWTLWSLFRLHRTGSWMSYLLFGLLAGLGLLSKYNFGVFLAALLLAAFSMPGFRQRLFSPRVLVSLALVGLITLPHFLWAMGHADQALASQHKFEIQERAFFAGIWAVVLASLAFLGPLLLAYGLSWRPGVAARIAGAPDSGGAFLLRLLLVLLALLPILVIASGTTHVKDRWLQPLLFFVPMLLVMRGIAKPRVFMGIGVLMMLVTALLLPGRTLWASWTGAAKRPHLPYVQMGAALRTTAGVPDVIISPQELLAGNMRLVFPDARIEVVESKMALRDRLRHYAKRNVLFITDNGGLAGKAGYSNPYPDVFKGNALSGLDWPLLYVPAMKHRVYWAAIKSDSRLGPSPGINRNAAP